MNPILKPCKFPSDTKYCNEARRWRGGKKEGNRMIMMNFILDAYNNGGRSRFACRTVSKTRE